MKIKKNKLINIGKSLICVVIGTFFGILTYGLFLHYNINVFGWNLGLIFAPLIAGYVETVLANRILGKNIGAISAFILFIDTTIYSFILKNPSLGANLITIGSIIVILQSAFPTLINHIILVVIGGILSKLINKSRKFITNLEYHFDKRPIGHWDSSNVENKPEIITYFNENESNTRLNSLNFIFITSSDMDAIKHELIGIYESEIILEKNNMLGEDYEKYETMILNMIKKGKDDCLVNLVKQIKKNGGNGVLNLSMNYTSIGGGDNIQITAMGMGIKI